MSATRSRKEELHYRKHRRSQRVSSDCQFCIIQKGNPQLIAATKHFKLLHNIFPYSLWDGQAVESHLMIVPKRHVDSLAKLPKESSSEYLKLLGKYEKLGYNSYARAPGSTIKSVVHQHTHLIKPCGRQRRFILFMLKPYLRLTR